MASSGVLDRESTSSGSAVFARNVVARQCYFDANRIAQYPDANLVPPSYLPLPTEPNLSVRVGAFANTVVGNLLDEGSHIALSGTGVLGSNFWRRPLYLILYDLYTTGIADGTQYLLKVERERISQFSETSRKSPDAEGLTRRALDLSGLTREQLAFAMGVRRQSVQNWLGARGGISSDNRQKLQDLVTLFEQARRQLGSARQVSNWLVKRVQEAGSSPLEMLANSKIDAVRGRLLRRMPVRSAAAAPIQGTGRVPRRMAPGGYSPPWSQPSRQQEFDPEEGSDSSPAEEPTEPYRNAPSPRVIGLARV